MAQRYQPRWWRREERGGLFFFFLSLLAFKWLPVLQAPFIKVKRPHFKVCDKFLSSHLYEKIKRASRYFSEEKEAVVNRYFFFVFDKRIYFWQKTSSKTGEVTLVSLSPFTGGYNVGYLNSIKLSIIIINLGVQFILAFQMTFTYQPLIYLPCIANKFLKRALLDLLKFKSYAFKMKQKILKIAFKLEYNLIKLFFFYCK